MKVPESFATFCSLEIGTIMKFYCFWEEEVNICVKVVFHAQLVPILVGGSTSARVSKSK